MVKNLLAIVAIAVGALLLRQGIDVLNPSRGLFLFTCGLLFFLAGVGRILFSIRRSRS